MTTQTSTHNIRQALHEIGATIRYPEDLAIRWRDRAITSSPNTHIDTNTENTKTEKPTLTYLLFLVLLGTAAVSVAAYGMTMHMHRGLPGMLEGAVLMPLAAGLAWTIAFPALYIINSVLGSRLDFSSTLLAATITVSFGSMAMLASIPITWFFSLALPFTIMRWLVNIVVFTGVGFCMSDVFLRVMRALKPDEGRFYPFIWLGLLTFIGFELFWLFGLFSF